MKTLLLIYSFLSINIFTNAFASITVTGKKFVNTTLWEAPAVSSIELKIVPTKNFNEKCEDLNELASREYFVNGTFKERRRVSYEMSREREPWEASDEFEVIIKDRNGTTIPYHVTDSKRNYSKLPYYHQNRANQYITMMNLKIASIEHEVGVQWSLKSLSEMLNLKMPDDALTITSYITGREGLKITAKSKEIACDLLAGRLLLKLKDVGSNIVLLDEDAEQLEDFYKNRLFTEIQHILKRKQQKPQDFLFLRKKGVHLGYRAGGVFERELETQDRNLVEDALDEFAEKFFNDELAPKPPLKQDGIEVVKEINDLGAVSNFKIPVSVTLRPQTRSE